MKITEAKLRKMIRSVIREFVSSVSAAGGSKEDPASTSSKEASTQSTYDTKKAATQSTIAAEPKTANGTSKVYQRPSMRGGTEYADTQKSSDWTSNPDYTSWQSDLDTAETEEKSAFDALTAAQREDALQREPKQKPPTTTGKANRKKKKKD